MVESILESNLLELISQKVFLEIYGAKLSLGHFGSIIEYQPCRAFYNSEVAGGVGHAVYTSA